MCFLSDEVRTRSYYRQSSSNAINKRAQQIAERLAKKALQEATEN